MTLIALAQSNPSSLPITYVFSGILVFFGLLKIFQDKVKPAKIKAWIESANNLDVEYLTFGIGMMDFGKLYITPSSTYIGLAFFISGALISANSIGTLIGIRGREVIKENGWVGLTLGAIILVYGVYVFISNFQSILANWQVALTPALGMALGLIFMYFSLKKLLKASTPVTG